MAGTSKGMAGTSLKGKEIMVGVSTPKVSWPLTSWD
jgi:hypothetical protein